MSRKWGAYFTAPPGASDAKRNWQQQAYLVENKDASPRDNPQQDAMFQKKKKASSMDNLQEDATSQKKKILFERQSRARCDT